MSRKQRPPQRPDRSNSPRDFSQEEVLRFLDIGRRSNLHKLAAEFDSKESNYARQCVTTARVMDDNYPGNQNLSIEWIIRYQQQIMRDVSNTVETNHNGFTKWLINIFPTSRGLGFYPHYLVKSSGLVGKKTLMEVIDFKEVRGMAYLQLARSSMTYSHCLQCCRNAVRRFKQRMRDINDTHDDIERIIYDFCQDLEQLHLFHDGNCRTLIMGLMNTIRKANGLPSVVFANPNMVDLYGFKQIIRVEGAMQVFKVGDLRSIHKKAMKAHLVMKVLPLDEAQAADAFTQAIDKCVTDPVFFNVFIVDLLELYYSGFRDISEEVFSRLHQAQHGEGVAEANKPLTLLQSWEDLMETFSTLIARLRTPPQRALAGSSLVTTRPAAPNAGPSTTKGHESPNP